jgi:hypothetical protein
MKCARCHELFGSAIRCQECGIHKDRPVRPRTARRKRPVGGKYGRNSGKVRTQKN